MTVLIWRYASPIPLPGLHGKPLMPIRHVICATEAYLQQHGTPYTPQDLRAHSCISLGETPADARWKFRREGKTETVQTYGRYAANHTAVRLDAVRQHLGSAACRCSPPVRRWRTATSCRCCPSGNLSAATQATCGYCGREISICPPRMRAMIDYLSETVPALSAGSTEPAK